MRCWDVTKFVLVVGLMTAACGSDKAAPDAPRAIDAAHVVDTAPTIDAAPCNTLTLPAPVSEINVASAAPAPIGGTIMPGTYILTAMNVYTGTGGPSGANGNTIAAKTVDVGTNFTYIQDEVVGTNHNALAIAGTFTVDTTAKTVTTHPTCPTGPDTVFGLDATSTSYTLYTRGGIIVNGFVFTLQ